MEAAYTLKRSSNCKSISEGLLFLTGKCQQRSHPSQTWRCNLNGCRWFVWGHHHAWTRAYEDRYRQKRNSPFKSWSAESCTSYNTLMMGCFLFVNISLKLHSLSDEGRSTCQISSKSLLFFYPAHPFLQSCASIPILMPTTHAAVSCQTPKAGGPHMYADTREKHTNQYAGETCACTQVKP